MTSFIILAAIYVAICAFRVVWDVIFTLRRQKYEFLYFATARRWYEAFICEGEINTKTMEKFGFDKCVEHKERVLQTLWNKEKLALIRSQEDMETFEEISKEKGSGNV